MLALGATLGLPSCSPSELDDWSPRRSDPVLSSQVDAATTSVFLLDLRFDNDTAAVCSAVLVSPQVLLTAAHCVEPALHSATSVTVKATNTLDDSMLTQSDFIAVTTVARHPQWSAADTLSPYDVAGLLLASTPAATPTVLLRMLPSGLVGHALRVVGYGRTTAGVDDSGTRRSGPATVTQVTPDLLELGVAGDEGICGGDSGGPSFLTGSDGVERVAGIHSATRSSSCGAGNDIRVDVRLDFIDGFIATNDPPKCTADGRCATGCTTPDPDCACPADGVCASDCTPVDPDCLLDGAVCQAAASCAGRQCVADRRGFSYCSRPCVVTADCQLDMTCVERLCQVEGAHASATGGCASTAGGSAPLLAFLFGWRRRHRCSTHASTLRH
jgi:hypothetical protein